MMMTLRLRRLTSALFFLGLAAPAAAQSSSTSRDSIPWTFATTFDWSQATVDTAQYRTVESCLVSIRRIRTEAETAEWLKTRLWRDSLPPSDPRAWPMYGGPGRLEPLPEAVVATARWCTRKITPDDALRNKGHLERFLQIYLAANRDAEVTEFVAKRLAGFSAEDTTRRFAFEDTILAVYQDSVQPVRYKAAETLLEQRLQTIGAVGMARLPVLIRLYNLSQWVGDTATRRKRAEQIVAEWNKLPAVERDTLWEWFRSGGPPTKVQATPLGRIFFRVPDVNEAQKALYWPRLLDSLRHSTAAYMSLRDSLVGSDIHKILGSMGPPITPGLWFRLDSGDTGRPRRGRVEFVVDISPRSCTSVGPAIVTAEWIPPITTDNCVRLFAVIRRLAKRFPEVGITVRVLTTGWLFHRVYEDPKVEAEVIRQWLHDAEQLPGALAVYLSSPPSRRPAPDRRVIGWKHGEGDGGYGGDYGVWGNTTLIGRDGRIITTDYPPADEDRFTDLVKAALQQPK